MLTLNKTKSLFLNPNLQIVFGITLMGVLGVSSITPAFPKIINQFGLSHQEVGWLVAVFTLPGIFLTPLLGLLADRWGRKRILVPSLFIFGIAGGACGLVRSFHLLLILRFFQGVGAASLGSLNVTLIGDLFSGEERVKAMGYNASVLNLGTASYPALGGVLATLGWFYPFFLPLFALPLAVVVCGRLQNPEPKAKKNLNQYLQQIGQSLKQKEIITILIASGISFIMLYGAYLTYLPILMEQSFAPPSWLTGLLMSGMSLTSALVSSQLGRLSRLVSQDNLFKAAFLIYGLAFLVFPLVPYLSTVLIPVFLLGLAHGICIPTIHTQLAQFAPAESRAVFMSLNGMVFRLGQTVGPLFMGFIAQNAGIEKVFPTASSLAVGMLILLWGVKK